MKPLVALQLHLCAVTEKLFQIAIPRPGAGRELFGTKLPQDRSEDREINLCNRLPQLFFNLIGESIAIGQGHLGKRILAVPLFEVKKEALNVMEADMLS
jgi:hypothetical protein